MTRTRPDRVQSNSVRNSSSNWQNYNSTHITRIVTQACYVKWPVTSITWTVHCPISALTKNIAKFSNVISYHQPDLIRRFLSTSWRPLIFLGKKLSRSGKGGGSERLDLWDYRRNRISFNFVSSFLSARGSRSNSRWLPGTNLFTGIPRVIPIGVPWESRRELAKISA